jgi:hypothetical protein
MMRTVATRNGGRRACGPVTQDGYPRSSLPRAASGLEKAVKCFLGDSVVCIGMPDRRRIDTGGTSFVPSVQLGLTELAMRDSLAQPASEPHLRLECIVSPLGSADGAARQRACVSLSRTFQFRRQTRVEEDLTPEQYQISGSTRPSVPAVAR